MTVTGPAARSTSPPLRRTRPVHERQPTASALRSKPVAERQPTAAGNFEPDPYLDYGRFLTPEGGVLIVYKDFDERMRHTLWRLLAWTATTGLEAWVLLVASPLQTRWISVACLLLMALVNWLIVAPPIELYRSIEVRPDALILDGAEVFWRKHMEGWPALRAGDNDTQILAGTYGSRQVEFATLRRFDENDRMPELFAAHLQDAIKQLWQNSF